jgi:hypothetical protein
MASVDYNARVRKARQNVYSDAEIIAYLAKTDPKVKAAITSGYKPSEIIKFIAPSKAAPRTRGTGISAVDTAIDNAYEVLMGIPEGAYNLAAMVTDPISGMIFGEDAVKQAQAQRRAITDKASRTYVSKPRPLARNLGQSIAPGAAVTSTTKVLAPLASKLPVVGDAAAQILNATARGGIGVKGTSVPKTVGLKVVGGGTSGASTAALMGEDPVEGALYGAGIPVLGTVFKKLVGGGVDLFRMSKVKAGKILRDALGKDVEAAKAAFAQLSPNDQRLAQQVLIDAGVEPSPFFGVGKIVADQIDPDTPARILKQQETARNARLADISGGADATAQRAAAEAGRREVSTATGPARDAALARANVAGTTVPAAETLANAARQRADEMTASGFVPRMRGLEDRSRGQIDAAFQNPEFFTQGGPINRTGAIAEGAGQRADNAINAQIGLRDVARDMEDVVADLAAEGMQPLRVGPIVQQLRSMAGQPGTRADELQRGTLRGLADKLQGLADNNGVIDARDLYQIRKTGLNDIVDTLLSGRQPGSGTKERTASLLTSARAMIDDAIEGSGGKDWKDYLVRTRQGFETVNRQKLAGEGAQLAKKSPNEFIDLMKGDRDDIVEGAMGTGQFDIAGMALADPRRYNAMKMSADELQNLNRMTELQSRGETAGGNLLFKEQPSFLSRGIRSVIGAKFPSVAYAGQGLNQTQRALMAPEVQKQLATAYESGPNMARAMNEFPTATRVSEQVQQISPTARNVMAQQFASPPTIGSEFGFPEIDPDSGEPLVDIDFSEGYPVPIYGRISRNSMRR